MMALSGDRLPQEVRAEILRQVHVQLGYFEYQQLVGRLGEDAYRKAGYIHDSAGYNRCVQELGEDAVVKLALASLANAAVSNSPSPSTGSRTGSFNARAAAAKVGKWVVKGLAIVFFVGWCVMSYGICSDTFS